MMHYASGHFFMKMPIYLPIMTEGRNMGGKYDEKLCCCALNSIFGFEIAYYGIIIGCAILIGFLIATSEAKRTRQNPEDYLDMGIVGVIAGIVGARA